MTEGASISITLLGDLSKPATVLIEKISDAIGGIAKPAQIRRVAKAEANAELIKAETNIKITELQERALNRLVIEEGHRQENIENITAMALPILSQDSKPENIEKDWLTNFFDRCRSTSDEQMQMLWASILAGEANAPGAFSKRTIEIVSNLDKKDADLFAGLKSLCWLIFNQFMPIIYDQTDEVFNRIKINFETLSHLEDLGLVKFSPITVYEKKFNGNILSILYFNKIHTLQSPANHFEMEVGKVLLTQSGQELAKICESSFDEEYYSHVLSEWKSKGYNILYINELKNS